MAIIQGKTWTKPQRQPSRNNRYTPVEFGAMCIIFAQHKYYEHIG